MYRIRGINYLHEEMNSISNMLSVRSSMIVTWTCFVGEICMNKILFKPAYADTNVIHYLATITNGHNESIVLKDIANINSLQQSLHLFLYKCRHLNLFMYLFISFSLLRLRLN